MYASVGEVKSDIRVAERQALARHAISFHYRKVLHGERAARVTLATYVRAE